MIRKPRKFIRLSSADKRLFVRVGLRLFQVRIKLWASTYKATRSWLEKKISVSGPTRTDSRFAEKIARFILAASQFVPKSSCLTQALAGESLLRELGYEPTLHIGVKKENREAFEAHAWLELNGVKIIGGPASSDFNQFRFYIPKVR